MPLYYNSHFHLKDKTMILVTGATGHLGAAAIQSLLKKGIPANEIAVLVRDENKAIALKERGVHIRSGSYNDYDSLLKALVGIDKLLLVSSSEMVDRLAQHKNVINAAMVNGLKHIVYTGIDVKSFDDTAIPHVSHIHRDTTKYLQEVGISFTLLNNNLYADLIPMFSGERAVQNGIFFPAGNGKSPFLSRVDMGEAAAVVLTTPGHEDKQYAIAAETAYSFSEIATMLSEITGQDVQYHNPDSKSYVEQLVKAGVPEGNAAFFASFGEAISHGELDTNRSDIEKLLGRKPVSLREFLQTVYAR